MGTKIEHDAPDTRKPDAFANDRTIAGRLLRIAQHHWFDFDWLIRHSLLYALLATALAVVYLILATLLDQVIVRTTGQSNLGVSVFVSTLVVSTLFWTVRGRAARLMFRFFYRNRVDPSALLTEMSEQISAALRLEDVENLLTHTIPKRLGVSSGHLQIPGQGEFQLDTPEGRARLLSWLDVWEAWYAHGAQPIFRSMSPSWLPAKALKHVLPPGDEQIELVLPLIAGDQLVGLWSLGSRASGWPYTGDEVRTLNMLARQVAVAAQNARLVSQLEAQGQWLAVEVRNRTKDLEEERNRLTVILQNMADGLLVTDADRRVLLTNAAFEDMARSTSSILVGQPLDWTVDCPALSTLIAQSLRKPAHVVSDTFELNELVLYASTFALHDHSSVITVLRDVTHEVEVDRMKSEFISSVSHELRTPLTSVLGFAKLARRTWERNILPALPADKAVRKATQHLSEDLDIIVGEGDRLTRLIEDVLTIADIQDGTLKWTDQPISPHKLADHVVQAWHGQAAEKGLTLSSQVADDLPEFVADRGRIQQVLTNLVSNAIKFTDQGDVTITARVVPPGKADKWQPSHLTDRAVLIAVNDTGIGIAEKDLPRLFSRFQQFSHNMLTDKPAGTGLGLAICKEIVAHYGGTIWAESVPDQGSTFSFVLPLSASGPSQT